MNGFTTGQLEFTTGRLESITGQLELSTGQLELTTGRFHDQSAAASAVLAQARAARAAGTARAARALVAGAKHSPAGLQGPGSCLGPGVARRVGSYSDRPPAP